MSEFNLDREVSIQNKVDATGKKWNIHVNKQNGMCYVRPEPDRVDAVIPKPMQGLWTKPSLLEPVLVKYLNESWDQAEVAIQKAERKKAAQKAANDKGTADN
jgi:hypothetical protein